MERSREKRRVGDEVHAKGRGRALLGKLLRRRAGGAPRARKLDLEQLLGVVVLVDVKRMDARKLLLGDFLR